MPKHRRIVQEYCNGCLSTNRKLEPIKDYYNLFLKIMEDTKNINKSTNKVTLMCWECLAMLHNAQRFKQRVKKAQEFLNAPNFNQMARTSSCLSNLTSCINTDKIQEICEQENPLKAVKSVNSDDKPFHVVKEEVEINIGDEVKVANSLKKEFASVDMEVPYETEVYHGPFEQNDSVAIKEECLANEQNNDIVMLNTNYGSLEDDNKNDMQFNHLAQEESNNGNANDTKTKINEHVSLKLKYKVVALKEGEKNKINVFYKKIDNISENEMRSWMKQKVEARNYKARPYKCTLCFLGFNQELSYQQHLIRWHSEAHSKFQCDICNKTFSRKKSLMSHIKCHYSKYQCLLCRHETYHLWQIYYHLDTIHGRFVMCLTCGMKFEKRADFSKHYADLHSRLICDYCGKAKSTKQSLIIHIRRHHAPHKCEECNRIYSSSSTLYYHNVTRHLKAPTEEAYCVECDKQFDNVILYKMHMKTSTKHVTIKGVPCPECGKVYRKRSAMNNHFKLAHLKKTNHFCVRCSRYFLNDYQYRRHVARVHEKIPVERNKMCTHCGRGFSTNRILINHIRTHTGERPFSCDLCSASFAQKTALVTHRRSIHKLDLKTISV